MKIAAFTAAAKATMVTMEASSAAHHGLALAHRTTMKTRTANGTATSAMPKLPGTAPILSISGGHQRRQQAAQDAAGCDRDQAVARGVGGSDRVGQRSPSFSGSGGRSQAW